MTFAAQSTTGIALISLVFIVGGYLFIGGLWYVMVKRPGSEERRALEEREADRHERPGDPS